MTTLKQTLENYLQSPDFKTGVIASTKAGWGGSSYHVLLHLSGQWENVWTANLGDLRHFKGIALRLPQLEDDDYSQVVFEDGHSEEEFFDLCFEIEVEILKNIMRKALR